MLLSRKRRCAMDWRKLPALAAQPGGAPGCDCALGEQVGDVYRNMISGNRRLTPA